MGGVDSAAPQRLVILGGGITGLAAAFYALRESKNLEVTILEATDRFGGQIRTIRRDGYILDAGPDGFLARKTAAVHLCRDLGIAHRLVSRPPEGRTAYIRRESRLQELPRAMRFFVPLDAEELTCLNLLSTDGVDRLFREPEIPRRAPGAGESNRDESIAAFFTRRFGEEMYRYLAEPLAAGVFAGDGEQLSIEATFPELPEMERRYGAVLPMLQEQHRVVTRSSASLPSAGTTKEDIFRSFPDGLETLVSALVKHLEEHDRCRLLRSTVVRSLRGGAGARTWRVLTEGDETLLYDAVICALPGPIAAGILEDVSPDVAFGLGRTGYSRSTAVFLGYPRATPGTETTGSKRISGSGYLVPRAEGSSVLACTWSSRKWPGRAPGNRELFRVFIDAGQDRTDRTDTDRNTPEEIARRELRETLGITASPELVETVSWNAAVAQYTLGHLQRRDTIRDRLGHLPGIAVAGSAIDGAGIPDCIVSGRRAVHNLLDGKGNNVYLQEAR